MPVNIITDVSYLKKKCEPVASYEEAESIANLLFDVLKKSTDGVGLAANQIGINKRVCVINVTRPIWLMNPTFINASPETINFNEACLSFPNQVVITKRYKEILVNAENIEENMIFGPKNMLECVCVQHEICHLNGETMFDYTI